MHKSELKLFYMTHTFVSEDSLHSWLLWPMVWHGAVFKHQNQKIIMPHHQHVKTCVKTLLLYHFLFNLNHRGTIHFERECICIKQTTKDLIEVSRFFFRKISKITQQKAWKKLPFNIEVHGV